MGWLVICTKPKWEIKVTAQLSNYGINCYCPTIMVERKWSDRIKKTKTPLFNNYVFVQLKSKDRNLVFLSPGVVRYLYWNNDYAIVRDDEIETVKKWINLIKENNQNKDKATIGSTIKIIKHPLFNDHKALLKEIKNNEYILVLETLGYLLRISKDEDFSLLENPTL